ncbi:SAM-dependent methyltransferase /23S rRNA m(5)C-1962 methyltransferase [Colwellia chukchiensis]|uniref:Ribosomal RNA large subunit methyltransferase I n=1 Tax=Colwellia chukchiensis TaxID=641665 RepID=A0A1H7KMS0_9GAMM|nr:class I SAM-dependent methyltransferase [Colwellia chukchiensis]SEK87237.1 SAM-dependent methyltransferase /23S rRNA m(5)C-1962 methyltransferase [Colwellia chukchiensis]
MSARIYLKVAREKSLRRKHPWIFSQAINKIKGKPLLGETVDIFDSKGNWLAKGAYSPESQISIRVWSYDVDENIDHDFFRKKLLSAQQRRDWFIAQGKLTGYRLIAGESDGLPGITIDKYDNFIVCQLLSAGADFHRYTLVNCLKELYPNCHIYERSDVDVRKKEGLTPVTGWLTEPQASTECIIEEHGIKIHVDVAQGHKTGFYLDQRDSRLAAGKYANNKSVLNCFSYTGTFALHCAANGAKEVINVDVSDTALALAKQNVELNQLTDKNIEFIKADVFKLLRQYRDEKRTFDMIILDPPKFVESKAQLTGACRGYKDINMLAMQLLKPNGTLLTFSCSGLMESNLFQKVVADAALDAQRNVYFVDRLHQAADHPVASYYPEGYYLKGLVCQVE